MIQLPEHLDLQNKEFLQAWNLLRFSSESLFLTGKAGTGKSTFLRYICENTRKKYVVLAPTGVAAVNVGGATLHSFFQIPLRPIPPDDPDYSVSRILKKVKLHKNKLRLIRALDLIIIDEVSMVRPDIIDYIDRLLRAATGKRKELFGGKQLLLVGDIFQLEPVVTPDTRTILSRYYTDFFFFNALAFSRMPLVAIELKKVYRQTDPDFIAMLDRIRVNAPTPQDFRTLNTRLENEQPDSGDADQFTMTLAARRDIADAINARCMQQNPNEEKVFKGTIEGEFPERSLPTDLNLAVKKDEQIILLKNDRDKRWVNGTLARIEAIENDNIRIVLEDGSSHALEPEVWENIKYTYDEAQKKVNEEIIGRFIQYPIKAAWALTVHKSQGLTFNKVAIDLGNGAFSAGQTYVALSRCRSIEGLSFKSPISPRDVIVSHRAVSFSQNFNDEEGINRALRSAKAKILYSEALDHFKTREMRPAVEKVFEAYKISTPEENGIAARFIANKLSLVNQLEQENARLKREIASLAEEYCILGAECIRADKAGAAALSNYDKALRLDPEKIDAKIGRVVALILLDRTIEAASTLDEITGQKKYPKFPVKFLIGKLAAISDQYDEAILNLEDAAKLNKKIAAPHLLLAQIYDKLDMADMGDAHRSKAHKISSKHRAFQDPLYDALV